MKHEDDFSELDDLLLNESENSLDNDQESNYNSNTQEDYNRNQPTVDNVPDNKPKEKVKPVSISGDEDDYYGDSYEYEDNNNQESNDQEEGNIDLIDRILAERGIQNKTVIYRNDDGENEEIPFDDLDYEEQMSIINGYNIQSEDDGISEDDRDLLNLIKSNDLTDSIYSLINEDEEDSDSNYYHEYKVDDFSDNELFVHHLKSMYPSYTEDEIIAELEEEVENESRFQKKIDSIRQEYRNMEDNESRYMREIEEENYIQDLIDGNNALGEVIDEIDDINNYVSLEENDKKDLFEFISVDGSGMSQFDLALKDPKNLIKAALLFKEGDNIMDNISSSYEELLTQKNTSKKNKTNASLSASKPKNSYVSNNSKKRKNSNDVRDLDSFVL